MLNYCDSFDTYGNIYELQSRYSILKNVGFTSISGSQWLTTNSGSIYLNLPSHHKHSYSFDFFVHDVTGYPFYICGLGLSQRNSASIVSGGLVVQVNANRSITIVTPDSNQMTSTAANAATAAWSSASGLVSLTDKNTISFNVDLVNKSNNRLWLNGQEYYNINMPLLLVTSGNGIVLGCPVGQARLSYKNLVYRCKTSSESPISPPLSNDWAVGVLRPTGSVSYHSRPEFLPSGSDLINAVTGLGEESYIYSVPSGAQGYLFEEHAVPDNTRLVGVQSNIMYYSPLGTLSPIIETPIGGEQSSFSSLTSASSAYYFEHYPTIPNTSTSWSANGLDNLVQYIVAAT